MKIHNEKRDPNCNQKEQREESSEGSFGKEIRGRHCLRQMEVLSKLHKPNLKGAGPTFSGRQDTGY